MCDLYAASQPFSNASLYRQIVGSLEYLTFTKLDITYVVSKVNQFMHNPTKVHYSAVKRILRYLNGIRDCGILFSKGKLELKSFSDANWGGDSLDR